jgi:hypothetical protein
MALMPRPSRGLGAPQHPIRREEIMDNPNHPEPETRSAPASPESVAVAIDPAVAALKGQFLNGVGWFYWIGGLSIVNIGMGFADRKFLFGLGITELVDAVAQAGEHASLPLLALSVAISLGFIGLGYQGRKGKQGFILAGLVVYALDAGLLLVIQDWLSAAFHAFAGYSIFKGYRALKQILAGTAV